MGLEYVEQIKEIEQEIQKVVVGKNDIIDLILTGMIANGHILLEDIPGVGKTTLALAFSKVLSMSYKRMQFTPDVLPTDVTGFSMFNRKTNEFEFKEGAIMCNLFLADELNRTSPKTQSSLLEVMEEGKVTVDGVTREVPKPFFVMATQNPVGSAGTQKLPESQLDRFMMKLSMGYPDVESEISILKKENQGTLESVQGIISMTDLQVMQDLSTKLFVDDSIFRYISEFVGVSRNSEWVTLGISPRGAKALLKVARAKAFMKGKEYVTVDDVVEIMAPVAAHRLVLSPRAKAEGLTETEVLEKLRKEVNIPVRR